MQQRSQRLSVLILAACQWQRAGTMVAQSTA